MEILPLAGYLAAFLIGMIMGITGSGGSVIAVPVFNYLFLMNMYATTTHALFVVGVSSMAGVLLNIRKGKMDAQLIVLFAIPMCITVFLMRRMVMPFIPTVLFHLPTFELTMTRDLAITILFVILLAFAGFSMISNGRKTGLPALQKNKLLYAPVLSVGIGIATGITGIGGGFLIVPVLAGLLGSSIRKAIATSMFIIAIKSFIGFAGDVGRVEIDWALLLSFSGISLIGMLLGVHSAERIPDKGLKKGFGYVILGIGFFTLYKALF